MRAIVGPPPLALKPFDNPGFPGEWFASGLHRYTVCVEENDEVGIHVSIAHPERYPHWDDIVKVWRWAAGPELEGVICIPPERMHVNIHPNCFHVYEHRCDS